MFSYYGSKSKIAHLYPSPKHGLIIEPFAGSARYALKHFDHDVLLVDKYSVIVDVWHYLQQASENDILKLPTLKKGEKVSDVKSLCVEEVYLLGFLSSAASASPRNTVSSFAAKAGGRKRQLKYIASHLYKIRHWKIMQGEYKSIENQKATWFIDPPYQVGGHAYVENKIDYLFLGEWCKSRSGQAIVCENDKADWLPFFRMTDFAGQNGKNTEVIWSNLPHDFTAVQQALFTPSNIVCSGLATPLS